MKTRTLLSVACICLAAATSLAHAQAKDKSAKPAAAEAMDPKAMQEMMTKAVAIGPQHESLKKMVGEWNLTVKNWVDPSQPPQETKATSVVVSVMDGRFIQEQTKGEMMGMPFTGMGVTGYDNVLKKYVGTWMDNFGAGIMMNEGTGDDAGKVINWTGEASDPMSGKKMKLRMVSKVVDDNKHVFEMFAPGPDGKEAKMMEIIYDRKM